MTARARRRPRARPTTRRCGSIHDRAVRRGHRLALPDARAAEVARVRGRASSCRPCRAASRSGRGASRATSSSSAARRRRTGRSSASTSAPSARSAGYDCPDECFDPTNDGLYDVNYEFCVGCGKCAEVCPVQECIVMVDELQFDDDKSPGSTTRRTRTATSPGPRRRRALSGCVYPHRDRARAWPWSRRRERATKVSKKASQEAGQARR